MELYKGKPGENHNVSQKQNLYTEASPKSIHSKRQRKEKTVRDTDGAGILE